jgi:hypothetical protein
MELATAAVLVGIVNGLASLILAGLKINDRYRGQR